MSAATGQSDHEQDERTRDTVAALRTLGVVPVVTVSRREDAVPLADALAAGGLPAVEITFRSAAASDAIADIRRDRPDILVGAGTVVTIDQLDRARKAGALFTVAPGLSVDVARSAHRMGMPHVPGVATTTEVMTALAEGCHVLKVFPASVLGGPTLLVALAAPFRSFDMALMPTGGINLDNLAEYLAVPEVFAVGGTWIAPRDDVDAGRWDVITGRAAAAAALVGTIRPASAAR